MKKSRGCCYVSIKQEVYKLLLQNKSTKEIAEILNVSIRAVQKHKKVFKEANEQSEHKGEQRTMNLKQKKEVAKAMIIAGESLKSAGERIGTSKSTLANWSSKENLQQSQKEFLTNLRQEHIKEIIKNKKDRLHINSLLKESILQKAEKKEISKELQDTLKQNELTEQEILELSRLERLEKFELDKQIYKDKRLLTITEELANLSDDDIEKILEIIEQSKRVDSDE